MPRPGRVFELGDCVRHKWFDYPPMMIVTQMIGDMGEDNVLVHKCLCQWVTPNGNMQHSAIFLAGELRHVYVDTE